MNPNNNNMTSIIQTRSQKLIQTEYLKSQQIRENEEKVGINTKELKKLDHVTKIVEQLQINQNHILKTINDVILSNQTKSKEIEIQNCIIQELKSTTQKQENEIKYLKQNCTLTNKDQSEEVKIKNKIINEMKTTIEVQAEEIKCLHNKISSILTTSRPMLIQNHTLIKASNEPIKTYNRYEVLSSITDDTTNYKKSPQVSLKNIVKNSSTIPKLVKNVKPNQFTPNVNMRTSLKNINIYSDSHGRHVSKLIRKEISSHTTITGIVKPGAQYNDVLPRNFTPDEETCIIIMGGTNNMHSEYGYEKLYKDINDTLRDVNFKKNNVIMCTIPKRYDLPLNHPINQKVSLINSYLNESTLNMKKVSVIDLGNFERKHFTNHGLHLNYQGKKLLSNILIKQILTLFPNKPTLNQLSSPTNGLINNEQTSRKQQILSYSDVTKSQIQHNEKNFVSHW